MRTSRVVVVVVVSLAMIGGAGCRSTDSSQCPAGTCATGSSCTTTGCPSGQACDVDAGNCVSAASCDSTHPCDGGFCIAGFCQPPAANSTCAGAFMLVFDGGVATGNVDPRTATASHADCAPADDRQLLFTFTVAQQASLSVTTFGNDGGVNLGLLSACDPDGGSPQLQCAGSPNAALWQPRLDAGTYWLAFSGAPTGYTATLGAPVPVPANDTCASPTVMILDGGTASATGDTRGANDDGYAECGVWPVPGRDVVFMLPLPGRGALSVTATATSPGYLPLAMIDQANNPCGTTLTSCFTEPDAGTTTSSGMLFGATTAFVIVSGESNTAGSFNLTTQWTPASPNDQCTSPQLVTAPSTVNGDLTIAFDDSGGCLVWPQFGPPQYGPDVFYKWTAPTNASVTFTATPGPSSADDLRMAILPLADCGNPASCGTVLTADNAGRAQPESITFSPSKNATYLIAVGSSTTGSAFTLTVK